MMIFKDKIGNQITIYQAKSGGIYLLFGRIAIQLEFGQLHKLGLDLYSIEDFDKDLYNKHYFQNQGVETIERG